MNCERCPHMAKIINAMRPCQNCEAGKLHGEVHVSGWSADKAHAQRVISDHTSSTGVTALDPDAEDALRKAMATLFALDPVELLLVQHVMRGGSYASFGAPLLALSRRLRTKERELDGRKDGFRQLAKTWADSVADKMPQMRDVLRARIDG